ncbi:MAG: hypothetical protein LAP21_06730 [Acidobacteriia bacterium]|nr:hypothetical protein [Terriglobia bacterium]
MACKTRFSNLKLVNYWFAVVVVLVSACATATAQIEITLKNTFIEKYKGRATIDANFTVDKAHKKPNAPSKDADMHIAGRASEIGLPAVAEIMNAASQPDSVDAIHQVEGTNQTIAMTGAWRIWCEHGGSSQQVQGAKLDKITTTNPDHVFEIHPITHLGQTSLLETLHAIDGYQPKDASQAFLSYENKKSHVGLKKGKTTITTTMGGFNYVDFIMRINGDQREATDGRFVMAQVLDLDGNLLVQNRRMVFVKDSGPDKLVKALIRGSCLRVLGIPRIDLSVISWRMRNGTARPEVLDWNLPYEMIVVAAQEETENCQE